MKNRQFVNNNTAILFLFVIGSFPSLFFNLDLSAGVNRLARDARFRAGSRVFVYFDQD